MLAKRFTASFLSSYGGLVIFWKCASASLSRGMRGVLTFALDR
jgi:hypothetical protein